MRALVVLLLVLASLPSALAAAPPLNQPNAYAVVIGISQYREETIPKVAYAVKDAEAMAQMLEKQAGIPKAHIKLMTDGNATGSDFHKLGDWLKIKVRQPDATVYLYYAGHGTPNTKTSEPSLVPWDGDPDFPETLYSLKSLYAALEQLPSTNILVFLDSCFSGAAGRSILAKGARPMVLSIDVPLAASKKVIVMAAATGNQLSSDYDRAEHGLFTHAVLKGLQGAADQDKNGVVTVRELFPYVREQVSATAAEELTREQTPVLLPDEQVLGARSTMRIAMVVPGASDAAQAEAQQELKALRAQKKTLEEQGQQVDLQQEIAEEKRQLAEKQRQIEEKSKKLQAAKLASRSSASDDLNRALEEETKKIKPFQPAAELDLPGWSLSDETLKVAVMDQQVVMEQSKMGKRALEELKAYSSTRQKIINADDLELKELEQTIQSGRLTDSVRQEKQNQFQSKMEVYQRKLGDFNREIKQRQREMVAEYSKKVSAAAQVVAEKNGYAAILDKGSAALIKIVLYYDPALDVTDQLVKEFDRQNK